MISQKSIEIWVFGGFPEKAHSFKRI